MLSLFPHRRGLLLAAALLSACGAAGLPAPVTTPGQATVAAPEPAGVFGAFLAGRFAQSETDTRVAADRLLEALRRDPEQPELLARSFVASLLDGRADAQRLARRLPDNQAAQLLLIGSEIQAGRFERAEQLIRALSRQGPGAILSPIMLAWTQQGRGQTDQAMTTLRPFAEGGRLRGIHALHMALIADVAGRNRDAERYARMALAETPETSLRLLQLAGGILARNGGMAEALRLLEGLGRGQADIALGAADEAGRRALLAGRGVASPAEGIAEAQLALAAALRGQGSGEASLILSRLSLRLRPNFTPTLLLLAEQYAEERHPETALATLEGIAADDPLARSVALRRAGLLATMDRLADAEAVYRGLAAAVPTAAQPYARLGDMFRARSRFPEAVAAYDAALERIGTPGPLDWPLLYARGIANERSGPARWPRAEADFQRALELAPEQPYVMNYLAYTWVEAGKNLPEARRMLERAVELRPNDGNIVDSLGWALFKMGDIAGAVRWLERAAELESRNSVINDHLGDAYWAAGRQSEARFQWQRALRTDPEAEDIPRIEAKLRDGLPTPPAATARRND